MFVNICVKIALLMVLINIRKVFAYTPQYLECGPYGFTCDRNNKVRLCDGDHVYGPAFLCPENTICNRDSSSVCEETFNHIDIYTSIMRCHRNERIADPNVPDCKGYILCIPNQNRFQGIKFKCSGNTIFNGYTRTCSSPGKYKCPIVNTTKNSLDLFGNDFKPMDTTQGNIKYSTKNTDSRRTIECKNYKFSVTQSQSGSEAGRATYFCPARPVKGGLPVRCTIFSNKFCITLDRDDIDQFVHDNGAAFRRPRM